MDPMELIQQPKLPGVLQYSTPDTQVGPYRASGMLWINPIYVIFERDNSSSLQVMHTEVDSVELRSQPAQGTMMTLHLKTFRQLHFWIPVDSHAKNAATTIQQLSCPAKYIWLPGYQPMPSDTNLEGWDLFSLDDEYKRMGVGDAQRGKVTWRLTHINKDMKLCSTYPPELVVPADVEDEVLEQVARHRTHRRFPIVIYLDPISPGVLVRCSQPRIGPRGKTCYPDTQLFRKIRKACGGGIGGVILDTRSASLAQTHKSKGGGFEPTGTGTPYSGWKQHFCDLMPCKALQAAFTRFREACQDPAIDMSALWSKVESSGWLTQVRTCLFAAAAAAKSIRDNGDPVVIHGESGWDNTCVLTALTQLLLDPHFRTIKGFMQLIEKEWLTMGHPFTLRHSHFGHPDASERGPFFLLFLDCVHQCLHQFPFCFEFTDQLLIDLHRHSQVSDSGTFLFNNLLERQMLRDTKQAPSLWPALLDPATVRKYTNPAFAPDGLPPPMWLRVSYRAQAVDVWTELYCWHDFEVVTPDARRRQLLAEAMGALPSVEEELKLVLEEVALLEKQLGDGGGGGGDDDDDDDDDGGDGDGGDGDGDGDGDGEAGDENSSREQQGGGGKANGVVAGDGSRADGADDNDNDNEQGGDHDDGDGDDNDDTEEYEGDPLNVLQDSVQSLDASR
ncbi:hypothetical protein PTSG_07081 [Salpingoeca rosetta]|uniref:Myotubularin phosphatase domain-containing protein n=1 Tax=Salpingoeca rosetta (strain ATCC 50818 / BSB-021) TaxID=946362 RepID=F2UE01_SALR5|nr:uncharacterized protein PTSG_07081 [Salpingoeca rosetta]EGD74851.1 hypothetical protein PTSG_07081 [Salpingoeca rosetta]|eukprot:XP_004992496.1 hypothetical protein PTSG_07081 [Salpingoeca rosetta]